MLVLIKNKVQGLMTSYPLQRVPVKKKKVKCTFTICWFVGLQQTIKPCCA